MTWFIAVDGDDVGPAIRTQIVANNIQGAADLSQNLRQMFIEVSSKLKDLGATIIFVGGDSLLVKSEHRPTENWFITLPSAPCTISIGIGTSAQNAYLALQLAKAQGKNRAVIINGIQPQTIYVGHSNQEKT